MIRRSVCHTSVESISIDKRCRARQYAPVCVLQRGRPLAKRLTAISFTAFWHERSALSACARNIDNVSVGGNIRSRCGGNSDSTSPNNSERVSRLKNVYASLWWT